jgi:hypothetical protein
MAPPLASSATAPGRPCPLCGSGVADVLPAASDEKGHCFPRRRCTRCGTGFLDPLPTAAQLNAYVSTAGTLIFEGDSSASLAVSVTFSLIPLATPVVFQVPDKLRSGVVFAPVTE